MKTDVIDQGYLRLITIGKFFETVDEVESCELKMLREAERTYTGHSKTVGSCCLTEDNIYVFTASVDTDCRMFDIQTGKCIKTFSGHMLAVYACVLTSDSKHLYSGSEDKTIRMWSVETGKEVRNTLI